MAGFFPHYAAGKSLLGSAEGTSIRWSSFLVTGVSPTKRITGENESPEKTNHLMKTKIRNSISGLLPTCHCVKHGEIIADNLSKAGWSWGCVSAFDGLQTHIAATGSVSLCTRMKG
jgi:hypothetical protein